MGAGASVGGVEGEVEHLRLIHRHDHLVSFDNVKLHAGDSWNDEHDSKFHSVRGEREGVSVKELEEHFPEMFKLHRDSRHVTIEHVRFHAGDSWNEEHDNKFHSVRGEREGVSITEMAEHFPDLFQVAAADADAGTAVAVAAAANQAAPAADAATIGTHFLVAIDGSKPAHQAFEVAANLRNFGNEKLNFLEVVHVEGTKEYLAPELHSDAIRDRYQVELTTHVANTEKNSVYTGVDRNGETTKNALMQYVNDVVGITGRKEANGKPTIFGSTSGLVMRICNHPVLVTRLAVDFTSPNLFLFPTDRSDRVVQGFRACKGLIRDEDPVTFLHVYAEEDAGEHHIPAVTEKLTNLIESEKITNANVVCIPRPREKSLADTISDWSLDNDVAFTCITIRYHDHFGSTGEGVAGSKINKSNFIFVKEAGTVVNMEYPTDPAPE